MASIPNQLEADLNILKTLNVLQLKPPLAPNLRVLCWMKSPLSYASLFIGPSLQSVTLSTIGPDPNDSWAISVALVNIIQASPTIESLVVHDFNCEQTTHIRPATVGLTSCSRLRRLHLLRSISPDLVPILGQLPVLEELQLKFGDNSGHPSLEHSTSEPLFPRLKSFHALGADLASIPVEWILDPRNAPLLTELTFAATDNKLTADFLQNWFTKFCDRMALTALDVFIPAVELPPGSRATLETIRPLFALEGLVNLNVSFPFALNDDALGVIAETWPKLQTLNLGGRDRPFHSTDVTLCGVVRLVANSLSLRDLTINFNASDVAAARKSYEGRACPHLRGLWAGNSCILDEDSVAAFLRKVFPRVRMKWDHLPRNAELAEFHRRWWCVDRIIQDTTQAHVRLGEEGIL